MRKRFNESSDNDSPPQDDRSLMCRMPGCTLRWAVDISHGKVCSFHDEQLHHRGIPNVGKRKPTTPVGPIPISQAVPHWQDDAESA